MGLKREKSLNRFLTVFLLRVIGALLVAVICWLLFLKITISGNFLIPANHMETVAAEWIDSIAADDIISENMIPEHLGFAIFSKTDNAVVATSLSDQSLAAAKRLYSSSDMALSEGIITTYYRKVSTNTQVVVVSYKIRAQFQNELLAKICPDAESLLTLTLFATVILFVTAAILHASKLLKKKILIMQEAAENIREKNLDFTIEDTGIKELNQVMTSLDKLKEELNTSLKEKWELEQDKKEQLSALAHDIKTPLTIIRGNEELLSETNLDAEQTEYLTYINQNTAQIQTYVSKMLEVSKSQHTKRPSHTKTSCHPAIIIEEIKRNSERLGMEKSLSFQWETHNIPQELWMDGDDLKRILNNLFDNAIQYSPVNGTISFEGYCENAVCHFTVKDEGIGFSDAALLHATKEFYRADSSRQSSEHFGMGLAIVNKLVNSYGGNVILENRETKGAAVTVILPAAPAT